MTKLPLRLSEKQIAALAVVLPFGFLILGVAAVFVLARKKPKAAPPAPKESPKSVTVIAEAQEPTGLENTPELVKPDTANPVPGIPSENTP